MRAPRSSVPGRGLALLLLAAAAGAACAASPSSAPSDGDATRAASAIVGGAPYGDDGGGGGGGEGGLDPRADAIVALLLDDGRLCSGSLVAPNLVLTARHCVSDTNSLAVRCTPAGNDSGGARFTGDKPPAGLRVFVGPHVDPRRAPAALGRKAVYDAAAGPCDADLAFLVLDRPILGPTPLAVRRYAPTPPDEMLSAVGYGRTEDGTVGARRRRDDVPVLASGPRLSASKTALGPRELEAAQSFCDGDSGGPALSRAGAVIGVASRGPACTDISGYVYATVRGFDAALEEAERLSGATVALEPGDAAQAGAPALGDASASDAAADDADDASDRSDAPAYDRGLRGRCAFAVPAAGDSGAAQALLALTLLAVACAGRRAPRRARALRLLVARQGRCSDPAQPARFRASTSRVASPRTGPAAPRCRGTRGA